VKSRRPKRKKQKLGELGEELAAKYLRKNGYRIIQQNFKSKFGEIDIVAREKKVLVFVEVKTRIGSFGGHPEEAISQAKIKHLKKAAYYYCLTHKSLPEGLRIDVVAITLYEDKEIERIKLFKNITQLGL
jgi:putative endonuclease